MSGFADYMATADLGITSPGGRTPHIYGPAGDSKSWCAKVLTGPTTLGAGRGVCKTCMQRVADAHQTQNEETPVAATRNDITTEAGAKVLAEIRDNISRISTLRSEGNEDGASELEKETEALISSLSGKGVAAEKAKARAGVREAIGTPLPSTQSNEVATPAPFDIASVPGAQEIVDAAAKRITEGLTFARKMSDVAKEIAQAKIRLAARVSDKEGKPDLFFTSDNAKQISNAMYRQAGEGVADTEENRKALDSLIRAVQYQQPKAREAYVLELDSNKEEAALFANLVAPAEGSTLSAAVAWLYGMGEAAEVEAAPVTEYGKEVARIERSAKLLETTTKRAAKLSDSEKAKLKEKLNALATEMIAKAAAL